MEKCYKDYIKDIVNEIQAELILNKKDIIFDDRYIITLEGDDPVIEDSKFSGPFVYDLYKTLAHFLTENDPINAIDKSQATDTNKSLLKATIKYIKNKYDIASKYFS